MLIFLRFSVLNEMRLQFPSRKYYLLLFATQFLALWTYALTSSALSPYLQNAQEWYGLDYFSYVVLGEIALLLPFSLMESYVKSVRFTLINKLEGELILSPKGLLRLTVLSFSMLFRELVNMSIFILFAYVFFDFAIPIENLLLGFGVVLLSLPFFLGLGAFIGMIVILTGRGGSVVSHLNFLFSICAGMYFPLTVFSKETQGWLLTLSFPTKTLETVRAVVTNQYIFKNSDVLYLLISSVSVWLIVFLLYPKVCLILRQSGRPTLVVR